MQCLVAMAPQGSTGLCELLPDINGRKADGSSESQLTSIEPSGLRSYSNSSLTTSMRWGTGSEVAAAENGRSCKLVRALLAPVSLSLPVPAERNLGQRLDLLIVGAA